MLSSYLGFDYSNGSDFRGQSLSAAALDMIYGAKQKITLFVIIRSILCIGWSKFHSDIMLLLNTVVKLYISCIAIYTRIAQCLPMMSHVAKNYFPYIHEFHQRYNITITSLFIPKD